MMNTGSEEWKSLWAISCVHSPPLLLSPTDTKKVGPLIFNPSPKQHQHHHHLLTLPCVSPQLPPPYPNLSLSRFLRTSSSSILPSITTSIASQLSSSSETETETSPDGLVTHNSLQLMRCPATNSILAFFPTGSNSDQLGVLVLTVKNSRLIGETLSKTPLTHHHHHRILKISVTPLADCDSSSGDSTIGYLLACTTNSVHYYNIRIKREHFGKITPRLGLVGNKLFKNCLVIHACWSPHMPEESLVLLENGDLFLFDLDSILRSSPPRLIGKKYKVLWDDSIKVGWWLTCDFSWNPRLVIVVHSNVVFLVNLDCENYNIVPLLKLDGTNDRFVTFSIAAPDRFYFTSASNHTVFLCDIRKPMIPLLRWAHNVANPSYVLVSSLSQLRSHSEEDATYSLASEAGYGILLGSFWNCEFSLFCYGPDVVVKGSFYAWGLPSDLSLVTNQCRCGTCLVKEEFSKDQLHSWINWQQKKEIVLGFGILDKEISSQLCKPDTFGGFTVITLTSSGNLESHRYCASWDYSQNGHIEQALDLEDSVLYETGEDEYKFRKVFQYLKLDWLIDGYLKSDLARNLTIELNKNHDNEKASFRKDFHDNICQFLNTFSSTDGSLLNIDVVFKDINLPMSIHEIALTSLWANLPKAVLSFGFCMYSDLPKAPENLKNVPFEFLEVPCEQPHLPPFFFRFPSSRSNKWSAKQKPSDSLVGPVIPIPFLMTFHKTRMLKATDNRPADLEIDIECDEVMRVANEVTSSDSENCKDYIVSLAADDDNEDDVSQSCQPFASYKPVSMMGESVFEDEKHSNLVFRVGEKDVEEVFDPRCPLKFKFNEKTTSNFAEKEMKAYKLLVRQYSNYEKGFSIYKDYMSKSNIHK